VAWSSSVFVLNRANRVAVILHVYMM